MKEKLVLIGNGMAGVWAIEEIIKEDPDRFEITIFGAEPHPNYNRILLSKVLQGDTDVEDIVLNSYEWYEKNNIELHVGDAVVSIDRKKQEVESERGIVCQYDRLIIATGSHPFMLPMPGADKEGVIAFRNIKDCETMIDASKNYKKAIVIGGGLLGLEAARGLLNLNMEVDVIHIADYLMERQLDEEAGKMLKASLEEQGMRIHVKKQSKGILGKNRVEALQFHDGSKMEADLIVMAVGIKPNMDLGKVIGLDCNRAIIVDDYMQTSDENIYAVGECAEHRGTAYGLVAPLYEQGRVLAKHICRKDDTTFIQGYEGSIVYTQLKVSGVDVFSAGKFVDTETTKSIRVHDEFEGIYKKVTIEGNHVVGAVLFGDTDDSPRLLNMMRNKEDISGMSKVSLLPSEQDNPNKESVVVSMGDEEIICGCNGVSKGTIVNAIREDNLSSVDEIKKCTNASRSCGGCKSLVADLLAHTTGNEAEEKEEALCECTTLTHEQVVAEIREKELTYPREVMNVLEWKSEEGCNKCRPAINYYLKMVDPIKNVDDPTSKFVNERVHANINNDGTFTVIPRMYGGVTNPDQLRKIAEVAEKYSVPLVKLTGGQRIDLLGIKKEDLPNVWSDLGMRSGSAYAKALRTVKTCVGENFCRFGTQDSVGFGIELEKKFEYINTPHKVKMAVSACPRNCAESGIKDFGIVGVEGAWELYVGGNGGVDLRGGDLFCKVEKKEELVEIIGAFLQYYREHAHYLERTSHFIERVGLEIMKKVVLEDLDSRKVLNDRLELALSTRKDPWMEISNDEKESNKFKNTAVKIHS